MEATEAMEEGIMLLLFLATFPFYRHPGCVCACTFTFLILLDRIATTICILNLVFQIYLSNENTDSSSVAVLPLYKI